MVRAVCTYGIFCCESRVVESMRDTGFVLQYGSALVLVGLHHVFTGIDNCFVMFSTVSERTLLNLHL